MAAEDAETFKADANTRLPLATQIALSALRGLMIINGGAIVALFTFIGNAPGSYDRAAIWWAFTWFASGLFLTMAANILGYFTQSWYFQSSTEQSWNAQARRHRRPAPYNAEWYNRWGSRAEFVALVCVVLALISFGFGSWNAIAGVLPPAQVTRPAAPHPTASPVRKP